MAESIRTAFDAASSRNGSTEALLAARCARGDAAAFDELIAAHRDRLGRLVYRLLGWSADADDVVQEVFLSALRGLKRFRGEGSLSTWLTRIAINECHSHRRKLRVRLRALSGAARQAQEIPPRSDAASMDGETFTRVRQAVQALPPRYREVVVLRYLEEMPTEQVAEVLALARRAVDVRLHRARRRLKELLGDLIEE